MREINRLWIDCDPGIDDAMTLIATSVEEEFEIVGISSVNGNVNAEIGKNNIAEICKILGLDIPIYKGEDKSLSKEVLSEGKYSNSGLGYYVNSNVYEDYGSSLSDELYFAAKESEKLDILVLGPATNIAKAILKYPDIVDYLGSIFVMGGTLNGGNVTSNAEFNIYKDPKAFNVLLESELNIFLFSLDLTTKFGFSEEEILSLNKKDTNYKNIVDDMLEFLIDERDSSNDDVYLHDIFTLYGYIYKDGIIYEQIKIKTLEDEYDRGRLIPDEAGKSVYYAVKLNEDNFKDYVKNTFA